jgi:uncharacterized protein YjbI with pentapeptide repeats
MANPYHHELLRQGVDAWNAWREKERSLEPDLTGVYLGGADLGRANLKGADFSRAHLRGANLIAANLGGANLRGANLVEAKLLVANLVEANLSGADLSDGVLIGAHLSKANLSRANLTGANLVTANLNRANLSRANLSRAGLNSADLTGADLSGADLNRATLIETNFTDADLTGCHVYGIAAWGIKLRPGTKQQNLVITSENEPEVTLDSIEMAQFVYLLLHNEKIRDAIDTIGKKAVLLLGRFTGGRIVVLERLKDELRKRDLLPIIFNFDKPETKDFTETVRLLAGLSRFVIVDITNPRSAPLELQAAVPEYMIPFVPIIERGEKPFSMFRDLWIKHREWVLDPIRYPSVDRLIEVLDTEIIEPAQARFAELLARKAEDLRVKEI